MNKNILLTGPSGFIGSNLKKYLENQQYNIVPLNIRTCETEEIFIYNIYKSIKSKNIDLSYDKIDALLHIGWGDTDNPWSNYHLKDNIKNSKLLLNFAKELKIKKIIFCGSMNEYGNISGSISEDSTPGEVETYYAKSKSMITDYGISIFENTGLDFYSVRPFYVYGNVLNKKSLISQLIECYYSKKAIDMSSCKAFRDYVHVDDVVKLFYLILSHQKINNGIYNIGYGSCVTVREFVENFWLELGGDKNMLNFDSIPDRKEQAQPVSFSNNLKIKKNFNWIPQINLNQGLKLMIKKIKKNKI